MRHYVGKIGTSSPLAIAERAIGVAEDQSPTSCARYALYVDEHERIHAESIGRRRLQVHGWIATFNRRSDPDWLADEIKAAA